MLRLGFSALLVLLAGLAEGSDNRDLRAAAVANAAWSSDDICAAFGPAPGKQICAKSLLFNSTLDHFDPTSTARWEHRYLFRDDDWGKAKPLPNGCPGPILLCAPGTICLATSPYGLRQVSCGHCSTV